MTEVIKGDILKPSALSSQKEDHIIQYDWKCNVQSGDSGVVLGKDDVYQTAFFEAFPNEPSCFIRGEGKDIAESETNAWNKYIKIKDCNHEMERRDRTDGYGFCKHCSYCSTVFEPLTKCCKCGVKTAYTHDFRNKWYCEKHAHSMPNDPNSSPYSLTRKMWVKFPRKYKKKVKLALSKVYSDSPFKDIGKIRIEKRTVGFRATAGSQQVVTLTRRPLKGLIKSIKEKDKR